MNDIVIIHRRWRWYLARGIPNRRQKTHKPRNIRQFQH